ncbi:2-amino-4-hydroxy-6-hydroxymethyldihydropteridine diphosphokinase [Candidatus Desantisbacteria bacterium]|nr:2-amino-4-hydroxy-6-hydroxymethyldihydropteridine diphosphokinase [Candidatus Desantisbacteria bacterium]
MKIQKNVYLGLGSNLGNREKNIVNVLAILSQNPKVKILKISSFYETEPVGYKNQGWFLNCVILIKTSLPPLKLLSELKNIELELKRKKNIRFGPRTIDMDILMYGSDILRSKQLIIPHPRMHERRFVLAPLAEIASGRIHPVLRKRISTLLKILADKERVKRYNKTEG